VFTQNDELQLDHQGQRKNSYAEGTQRAGFSLKIMTDRNKRVRSLLQKLSSANWEILKLESK